MDTTVAVTGAASGLGLVVARALLARGAEVVLVDRDAEALDAAVGSLGDGRATGVVGDLGSVAGVHEVADALTAGRVGGLVNNAGGWMPGEQYPTADADAWQAGLTLNLVAPMLLTQRLWPLLASSSGAVVCVGSSGGVGPEAYASPEYAAAKAGLHRFVASLGGRDDVRVTAVVPGWIGLDRAVAEWDALSPERRRAVGPLVPPEDVAGTVVRLLEHGRPGEVVELLRGPEVSART